MLRRLFWFFVGLAIGILGVVAADAYAFFAAVVGSVWIITRGV